MFGPGEPLLLGLVRVHQLLRAQITRETFTVFYLRIKELIGMDLLLVKIFEVILC
jgi:hypothetical protein